MQKDEVLNIYIQNKERLLKSYPSSENPVAVFTGGQAASGKGMIPELIENENQNIKFLKINGDDFRVFHPDFDKLKKDVLLFTDKTHIFCTTFKDELMKDAIENRVSFICEGTFRNPNGLDAICSELKQKGYQVEIHGVAAHPALTELGLYRRYAEEVRNQGFGRLATNHDEPVRGVSKLLDNMYINNRVDKIVIYSQTHNFANIENKVFTLEKKIGFTRQGDAWNNGNLPSHYVNLFRKQQANDLGLLASNINAAENLLTNFALNDTIKQAFSACLGKVKEIYAVVEKLYHGINTDKFN